MCPVEYSALDQATARTGQAGAGATGSPLGLSLVVKIIGDTLGTPERIKQCQTAANDEEKRQVNAATAAMSSVRPRLSRDRPNVAAARLH